jgi:hypothetical protein
MTSRFLRVTDAAVFIGYCDVIGGQSVGNPVLDCFTLKKNTIRFNETSRTTHRKTRRHMPEGFYVDCRLFKLQLHRGHAMEQLVEALRYKPGGRGFDGVTEIFLST